METKAPHLLHPPSASTTASQERANSCCGWLTVLPLGGRSQSPGDLGEMLSSFQTGQKTRDVLGGLSSSAVPSVSTIV